MSRFGFPALLAVAALLNSGCDGPEDCGDSTAVSAPCPPPPGGYGRVEGRTLTPGHASVPAVDVLIVCPGYSQRTGSTPLSQLVAETRASNAAGAFRVSLALDTTGGRHASWTDGGVLPLLCDLRARRHTVPLQVEPDTLTVLFAPQLEEVRPGYVTLIVQ